MCNILDRLVLYRVLHEPMSWMGKLKSLVNSTLSPVEWIYFFSAFKVDGFSQVDPSNQVIQGDPGCGRALAHRARGGVGGWKGYEIQGSLGITLSLQVSSDHIKIMKIPVHALWPLLMIIR